MAFAVAGGPGLPADAVLAAFVIDLHRLTNAAGSLFFGSTVTDDWLAGYESAFARLPPDHPGWLEYAVILAAACGVRADLLRPTDPGRAAQLTPRARQILDGLALPPQCAGIVTMKEGTFAQSLASANYLTPWPAAAASLTAPGRQPALASDLADAFEVMNQALGGPDGLTGAFRDLFYLDMDPAADEVGAETLGRLTALAERIPDARRASRAKLIAALGTYLTNVALLRGTRTSPGRRPI